MLPSTNIPSSTTTPATSFSEALDHIGGRSQRLESTPATSFSEALTVVERSPLPDPFKLQRYIDAQDKDRVFDRVVEALEHGGKLPRPIVSWMWFVFPQMDHCKTRRRPSRIVRRDRDLWPKGHALQNLDEARAILKHPILGPRMEKLAHALLNTRHADIFCAMNNQLLNIQRVQSAMTIFREASRRPLCIHGIVDHGGTHTVFRRVLDKHFSMPSDSDDETTWGEPLRPICKRNARHQPTLEHLETQDLDVTEKRMASKNITCVCGKEKDELDRLDEEFVKKVEERRRKRLHRRLINRVKPPPRRKSKEIDEAPPGWETVEAPTIKRSKTFISDTYRDKSTPWKQ